MKREPDNVIVDAYWRPDAECVERYRRQGWLITPPLITDDLLDAAWLAIRAYLDGVADHPMEAHADATDKRRSWGDAFDQLGYLSLRLDAVRRLVVDSAIGEIAARLMGTSITRLFHDRLIIKPANNHLLETAVGWHTDRAYWRTCSSGRMLTAWVPFDDVDVTMGALVVVPGSHNWRSRVHMATSHRFDMDQLLREAVGTRRPAPLASMTMRRGQISFHHCRALHGSFPNNSSRIRAALAIHLQPRDNRHRLIFSAEGRQMAHTNDLLCRKSANGRPDYTDPSIFPVLWRN